MVGAFLLLAKICPVVLTKTENMNRRVGADELFWASSGLVGKEQPSRALWPFSSQEARQDSVPVCGSEDYILPGPDILMN